MAKSLIDSGTLSFDRLTGIALALGAREVAGWTSKEEEIASTAIAPSLALVESTRAAIQRGCDPLGDAFCKVFSSAERRPLGATYTPRAIIDSMVSWADGKIKPDRVVDPGSGSARILVASGRCFHDAELVAVEIDPAAAILARGHLAGAGFSSRARVVVDDYLNPVINEIAGRTLFLGNPPYVRHHQIDRSRKVWLTETANRHGLQASQLSGLHVHFFLATIQHAKRGDVGMFVSASNWLDVNYGQLVRDLFVGPLGGSCIKLIEPSVAPFPGTFAVVVMTGFEVGASPKYVQFERINTLDDLAQPKCVHFVSRNCLESRTRWTTLPSGRKLKRKGLIELGELVRVHRGQATGANRVWIVNDLTPAIPQQFILPTITRASELFLSRGILTTSSHLRCVINLPPDLNSILDEEREEIERFLAYARRCGVHLGYLARHRKAWWAVELYEPAPILATYMARRSPAFVHNKALVRHLNVAHGLYPTTTLNDAQLGFLAKCLSRSVDMADGRVYSGGLTKFEPKELARVLVPHPDTWSETNADDEEVEYQRTR